MKNSVTLEQFLARVTPQDCWVAPIDKRLRDSLGWSGVIFAVSLGALYGLPMLRPIDGLPRFATEWHGLLLAVYGAVMLLYITLAIITQGFKAATLKWQWVAGGISLVGIMSGALLIALGVNIGGALTWEYAVHVAPLVSQTVSTTAVSVQEWLSVAGVHVLEVITVGSFLVWEGITSLLAMLWQLVLTVLQWILVILAIGFLIGVMAE
jgi:hypothetical protein